MALRGTNMTPEQQVQNLQANLNSLLAKRAELDEQITATRQTLQGVTIGINYQQSLIDKEKTEEEESGDDSE